MKTMKIALALIIFISPAYIMGKVQATDSLICEKNKPEIEAIKEIVRHIEISAYFQGQYQSAQKDVKRVMIGASNEHFGEKSFSRIGLRRAYVSTMYQSGMWYGLITLEIKDKSIWFSDAFISVTDPWTERFSASVGSINTLFGYELSISPSRYELFEGTSFIYSLFPDIYDIGLRLSYQAPEKYGTLKVDLALVAGNGIKQETDSKRDFVGSVFASSSRKKPVMVSGGGAYYRGYVYQGTENVYRMQHGGFVLDSHPDNLGRYAKREYLNLNAQLALRSVCGLSELRSEYFTGTQPAGKDSYDSPNSSDRPTHDTYIRKFNGGYIYYLQQLGRKLPLTLFTGYSWHDPNNKVSGNDVGKYHTSSTDLKYQTATVGLIWYPVPSVRLQAFYEMPFNEKSEGLTADGFDKDKKDNVFSFRIQYKY